MAFETSTLVNGEWTTRTLDVDTVLRHYDQQDKKADANVLQVDKAPVLGILTQTVIRSPLIHYILPARLRGPDFNDVAFIGEDFVQVKELRGDGFLWDLTRKENFGARIRNARVIGSMEEYEKDLEVLVPEPQIKDEDSDVDMDAGEESQTQSRRNPILPPQFLMLQLDTGDSIFLMLRQSLNAKLEFVITTRHRVSRSMLYIQPGMHLSVDPSSRYMAIACSEAQVAIYALKSREQLKSQYAKGSDLQHVVAETYIPFNGVIQKMEFLYPSAEDEGYVVLLVLVIIRGKTRMMVYEWRTGDDIRKIRPLNYKGHVLGVAHQMPLLLIPLKFKSTFILVSEKRMALFQNILEGAPNCTEFYDRTDPPTSLHHGSGAPLWAGWARPVNRIKEHNAYRDDIYIAREDGLLKFLEIDCESFVEGDMHVGDFEGRCGTALACIDYGNYGNNEIVTGDLLITGGDSCAGGAYLVLARETPLLTQPIENWTPAQDFVTTSTGQDQFPVLGRRARAKHYEELVPKPDRIFACVGKGSKGAITEFRYGLEARIGLQMEYEVPIMQAWVLSSCGVSYADVDGSLFILSFGESSVALRLSSDESDIRAIDNDTIKLDLRHRTIAVDTTGSYTMQVTEQSIVLINESQSFMYEGDKLLCVQDGEDTVGLGTEIHDAVIYSCIVLYTTFVENNIYLQLLSPKGQEDSTSSCEASFIGTDLRIQTLGVFSAHVTCLAMCGIERNMFAIVAEWLGDSITLSFLLISGGAERRTLDITSSFGNDIKLEAIVSIAVVPGPPKAFILLCGTRNGILLSLEVDAEQFQILGHEYIRIGATSAIVKRDEPTSSQQMYFVNCDAKAYALTIGDSGGGKLRYRGGIHIDQIWLTDALRPGLQQPRINSVVGQISNFGSAMDDRLLLVAGSQLLLASLNIEAKAVPRHLQIGGTPTRLLYSQNLEVLVVAASVNGKSTLLFIDPETGEDLSSPMEHKGGSTTEFVSGLGNPDERVFRLFEWSYVKDAKTWNFIIASTSTGRLLIISVQDQDRIRKEIGRPNGLDTGTCNIGRRSKIAYYTRHKFKCPEPVFSVTGFADGLLWCTGEKLLCDILDLSEKRFKRVAEYELPSMARNLEFANGTIYALTQEHSLEVLQLVTTSDGRYEIVRKYGDQLSRYALHHGIIDHSEDRPLHLISDKLRSLVGLWPTKDAKADTLETVFEGQLPKSVLKFRAAKCRPIWDPMWRSKLASMDPSIPLNSMTPHEVLGLSIDGSLSRFTVLDPPAWKFLRFLINLCIRSPTVCEFSYQDDPLPLDVATEPKTMMHVDGDILKRCLDDQRLEELLRIGTSTAEAARIFSKFYELLQLLHRDSLEKSADPGLYVEQAYADLKLYLRPML